jgi:DNA-directed RNA polymerase subunit H (RpoH/RPB5)
MGAKLEKFKIRMDALPRIQTHNPEFRSKGHFSAKMKKILHGL